MGRGLDLPALLLGTEEVTVSLPEADEVAIGDSEAHVGVAGGLAKAQSLCFSLRSFRSSAVASSVATWKTGAKRFRFQLNGHSLKAYKYIRSKLRQ